MNLDFEHDLELKDRYGCDVMRRAHRESKYREAMLKNKRSQ